VLDQDLQTALSRLNKGAKKRKQKKSLLIAVAGVALSISVVFGLWAQQKQVPQISADHLTRLIVIASRTSDNDPVRLMGDLERYMGKNLSSLTHVERANALSFLMTHIELHHNKQEMISY